MSEEKVAELEISIGREPQGLGIVYGSESYGLLHKLLGNKVYSGPHKFVLAKDFECKVKELEELKLAVSESHPNNLKGYAEDKAEIERLKKERDELKAQVEELKREVARLRDLNDENGMRADSWRTEYLTANRDCIHIRACLKEVVGSLQRIDRLTGTCNTWEELLSGVEDEVEEAIEKAKPILEGK